MFMFILIGFGIGVLTSKGMDWVQVNASFRKGFLRGYKEGLIAFNTADYKIKTRYDKQKSAVITNTTFVPNSDDLDFELMNDKDFEKMRKVNEEMVYE